MRKKQKQNPALHPISRKKRFIFSLFTFFIPLLLVGLFESSLRIAHYGGNTDLFISTPNADSPFWGLNPDLANRYFYRDTFRPTPRKDVFLKTKPQNGFRIFVLGGSTTAGFPYGNNLTFPRILHRRLVHTFPQKHIEVVNCAFTAINTWSILDFMDEILEHEPDLILMYAGHNEFYGALGVSSMESFGRQRWFVKSYLKLQRLKIFVWLRNNIANIRQKFSSQHIFMDTTRTVMSRIVKDKTIPLHSPVYKLGVQQFRGNMQDILQKAAQANVPVILSELVSNIHDHQPFVSIQADSLLSAKKAFLLGRQAEENGDFSEAKAYYYQAKDLDALRFRASEDMNTVVHELAEENDLPIVPMKMYFEQASEHELIGNHLMWEHLHPNSDGYFLMADAFFKSVIEHQYILPQPAENCYAPSDFFQQKWGFSQLDSLYAELAIRQLKGSWPFVPEGSPNLFMTRFQPQNRKEQIVFDILANGSGTLEEGHLKLAAEFEKNHQFDQALQEYRALIYTVPYFDVFYQPMIRMLLQQKKYETAISELQQALYFQDSAFVHKWIGQILLVQGETRTGIDYLQKAFKKSPHDAQIAFNLARAFFSLGRFTDGDIYVKQFQSLSQNNSDIQRILEFRELMLQQHAVDLNAKPL